MRYLYILFALVGLAACTQTITKEHQYSGFLDDYSNLKEHKTETGGIGLVWFHPQLEQRGYQKIILDPVSIYPAPKRESAEAKALIDAVTRYLDEGLNSAIGQELIVTDSPAANTVRLRAAVTGVDISNKNLAAYEYVPVAMVFAGATTAAGKRAQLVEVFLEAEMVDSITGEVLAKAVRKGFGDELENKSATLGLQEMRPQLERWIIDAKNLTTQVAGKTQ